MSRVPSLRSAMVSYCKDSFKWMSVMKSNKECRFDVTITDPPYTKEVMDNLRSGSLIGKKSVPSYTLGFDPLTRAQHSWLEDAVQMTRRWVLTFCAVEDFGRFQDLMGKRYVRGGIWLKPNSMGQLTSDRPATAYEGISFLHGLQTDGYVKKRWNGRGSFAIWKANGTRGLKGRHPNQKPLDLCLKLVALCSERGETVFDPFAGSGTIGVACVLLGRGYVGLDSDVEWVEKSMKRLASAQEEVAKLGYMPDAKALELCRMVS